MAKNTNKTRLEQVAENPVARKYINALIEHRAKFYEAMEGLELLVGDVEIDPYELGAMIDDKFPNGVTILDDRGVDRFLTLLANEAIFDKSIYDLPRTAIRLNH